MNYKYYIACFIVLSLSFTSFSQKRDSTLKNITLFSANLGIGYDIPGGDLKNRFGQSLNFSAGFEYMKNSNMSYGVDFTYIYGDNVKEDVLAPYRTERGYVIGLTGYGADIFLRERGGYLGLNAGKWFHGKKSHGMKLVLGAGYMYHQIRMLDDSRTVILADDPYKKGYDRLTKGFALKQELVYQFHSSHKAMHFNIGFNITEGFTKQVREINFDTGTADTNSRLDLLYGLKVMWQLPLYKSRTTSTGKGEIKYY